MLGLLRSPADKVLNDQGRAAALHRAYEQMQTAVQMIREEE